MEFKMKSKILSLVLLLVTVIIVGCKAPVKEAKIRYDRPLLPGQLALRKITNPYDLPDFTMACLDIRDLRVTINNSLNYLSKPSSRQFFPCGEITHSHAVNSLNAFAQLLDSGLVGKQLNQAIADKV